LYEEPDEKERRNWASKSNNSYPGISLIDPLDNEPAKIEPLNSPQDSALLQRRYQQQQQRRH